MRTPIRLCVILWLSLAVTWVHAQSRNEAKHLLDAALTEISVKGFDAATKDFNAKGRWIQGTMYVVVSDYSGVVIAHSSNEKLVGKNFIDAKDGNGKYFVRELIDATKAHGQADLGIRWVNPSTKQMADATFVAARVPGRDAYIAAVVFEK